MFLFAILIYVDSLAFCGGISSLQEQWSGVPSTGGSLCNSLYVQPFEVRNDMDLDGAFWGVKSDAFYICQISQHVSSFLFFSQETKETHDVRLFFFSVSKKISDHLEWQLGRLERVMQRDKLKRFPAPLPKLVAWPIHSPQQWMFLEGNPVLDLAIEYSGKLQIQVVASKQKPIKNS